ncbi:MAG: hypothetical protein HY815_05105 [Candidatus Riflebacteria bacterium]|nr:hypothetical protein [Candidatus Riflebacteria bacterium]
MSPSQEPPPEGICRVCGSPLSSPMVVCPACATPHHKDCWEYNRGCSIYGCSSAVTADVMVIEDGPSAPQLGATEAGRAPLGPSLVVLGVGSVLLFSLLLGVEIGFPVGLFGAIVCMIGVISREVWLERGAGEDQPATDPSTALMLEKKSVMALVNARVPHQLAQAYALFEQRHPRETLQVDRQVELATELIDNGYGVLGLEALGKALRFPGFKNDPGLQARRRQALLSDAAFAAEALGPIGGPRQVGESGLEEHLQIFGQCLARPDSRSVYLLAATPQGWGSQFQAPVALPSHPEAGATSGGFLVAGPYAADAVLGEARTRLAAGHPTLFLPEEVVDLPRRVETVVEAHLSQKEARFRTEGEELVLPWREVINVIFTRLETVEVLRESQPAGGTAHFTRSTRSTRVREVVDSHPIIEIHAGAPPRRLRIFKPRQEVFGYLGRRKDLSVSANMVLVGKDLVRFGPAIRASHGLCDLFAERKGPGSRFLDLPSLEEYVFWFWGTGREAVRMQWRRVVELLEKTAGPDRGDLPGSKSG